MKKRAKGKAFDGGISSNIGLEKKECTESRDNAFLYLFSSLHSVLGYILFSSFLQYATCSFSCIRFIHLTVTTKCMK